MRSGSAKWALLALAGCSSTIAVSASRSILVPGADLARTPICFAPPPPDMNPSDKPEYDTALHACESAASKQKVPMVPIAQGGCMVARMEWKDEESGGAIYMKSLKLTLGEPAKAIESSARMYGASGIFSEPDYYALCSAAFHDYPRPLSNEQVEVEPQ